jgi:hypothetical protein
VGLAASILSQFCCLLRSDPLEEALLAHRYHFRLVREPLRALESGNTLSTTSHNIVDKHAHRLRPFRGESGFGIQPEVVKMPSHFFRSSGAAKVVAIVGLAIRWSAEDFLS